MDERDRIADERSRSLNQERAMERLVEHLRTCKRCQRHPISPCGSGAALMSGFSTEQINKAYRTAG